MIKAKTPTIIVILGATGDLTAKKLVPAIYYLYKKKKLPNKFKVVGFSRNDLSDDRFRKYIAGILKKYKNIRLSKSKLNLFTKFFSYQTGLFQKKSDYLELSKRLQEIDGQWGMCTNKLFYLAVPPQFYPDLLNNLAATGLTKPCSENEGWTRVIVEKPFGKNLKTAQKLDALLSRLFKNEQIYPIDHYLGKEMMENILTFRFANNLLEKSWNNQHVERIEVRVLEKFGVEQRGKFYDGVGALRDVGQNHLLQMLALVTMGNPVTLDAQAVRSRRAEILRNLKTPSLKEIKQATYRAQYQSYSRTPGVRPRSATETYFKIRTYLKAPHWEGVPIILEHGKHLARQKKEIIVNFKHPVPCFCPADRHLRNKVIFSIEPDEQITIRFWASKPGFSTEIEERVFTFDLHSSSHKGEHITEHERLLHDCIIGDQTLFVSPDEVKSMWRFIDPIVSAWQKNAVPLGKYKKNTAKPGQDSSYIDETEKPTVTMKKEIGIVGLGKMGAGLAGQLISKGWRVVGYNKTPEPTKELERQGLVGAYSLAEMIKKLGGRRLVWLMVPAGRPVEQVLFGSEGLIKILKKGDTIIDGGNSYYKDSIKRAKRIIKKGFRYIDIGVSGGPQGARYGASLMIGGSKEDFIKNERLFSDLSVDKGYAFFPGHGAGHFVKMVHNGIEYGMMQAIAEGFDIMKRSQFKLDLHEIARVYNRGSVIESRLIKLMQRAFEDFGNELLSVSGAAQESGEGAWTVKTAHQLKITDKVLHQALRARRRSRRRPNYQGKIISALRYEFGGHAFKDKKKK